jgi:hypothetical protein
MVGTVREIPFPYTTVSGMDSTPWDRMGVMAGRRIAKRCF